MEIIPFNPNRYTSLIPDTNKTLSPNTECQIIKMPKVKTKEQQNRIFTALSQLFHKKEKAPQLPYVLDYSLIRGGRTPMSTIAQCYRYGNCDIRECEPDVLDTVKSNLSQLGIEEIESKNIKVVREFDSDKDIYLRKKVSYYDKNKKESIVFTTKGVPDYRIKYKFDINGTIQDCFIAEKYPNSTQRRSSKLKPYKQEGNMIFLG